MECLSLHAHMTTLTDVHREESRGAQTQAATQAQQIGRLTGEVALLRQQAAADEGVCIEAARAKMTSDARADALAARVTAQEADQAALTLALAAAGEKLDRTEQAKAALEAKCQALAVSVARQREAGAESQRPVEGARGAEAAAAGIPSLHAEIASLRAALAATTHPDQFLNPNPTPTPNPTRTLPLISARSAHGSTQQSPSPGVLEARLTDTASASSRALEARCEGLQTALSRREAELGAALQAASSARIEAEAVSVKVRPPGMQRRAEAC